MEAEKYLKTGEIAKLLGVDRKTIQRWAENGILVPAHKTGAGYGLYTRQQIAELCQSATNLLASATNCDKSPSIKNRTATNLQQAETRFELKNEASEPEKKSKSIRLIPAKMLVMTNDKLTKELFRCTPEEYHALFEEGGEIVEVKNFPKVGEIITPYWLELIDEYTDKTPLNIFAKAVFTACVSEWIIGNRRTTDGIIFRHITGKPRGSNAQPSPAMRELILYCVRKMMCTVLRVNMTEVCKHLNYNNGDPLILNAPILPCKYVEEVINGQESRAVIYFYDESPLLTIARVKNNQFLSVEPRLLNISNQSSSSRSISIRHCVIQRVLEIILHKLKPIIRFDYVLQICGLMDATPKKKCQAIHEVIEIFNYLATGGDILSFTIKKDGNDYQAIEFIFSQVGTRSEEKVPISGDTLLSSGDTLIE